jgi:hypothetical protein
MWQSCQHYTLAAFTPPNPKEIQEIVLVFILLEDESTQHTVRPEGLSQRKIPMNHSFLAQSLNEM